MPKNTKATRASKKVTPTVATGLADLKVKLDGIAPQLEALFTPIFEALEVCEQLAGVSNTSAGDDEEETPAAAPSRGRGRPKKEEAAKKPVVADDDDDEDDEPDFDEMDEDELEEFVEKYSLDVKLKGNLKKQRAAVAAAYAEYAEAADEADDDDLDDEPDFDEMDEDDLEEFVAEHKLKVKLSGSLKKQRTAVAAAYAEIAEDDGEADDDDDEWGD